MRIGEGTAERAKMGDEWIKNPDKTHKYADK